MKALDLVYCIHCGSIVSRIQADHIFKTGFYRVSIPLASCKGCAAPNSNTTSCHDLPHHGRLNEYETRLPLMA
ncbi:hypothetical protein ACFVVQ_15145 [Paenibacillus chitinolyticus]|uniref:Uncharacterized protein n=1 Tax=Paenibacillus chitinolyticus TaxID=79263 RepID=A0A410WS46_9BACL|nr:hypothetical protein [Paenibacillus chitinolyticus]MCY9588934.1 hypothetical protein [Paenibacillus chitinolyticus]MCY9595388.1 hypothetical protein [Paenibacillus chitinolyticus]QAV17164.1 hypothetical protein PC41400_05605 [Paenibacillus chitinolyticus]